MFAALIGIDRLRERDIRRIIARDDRFRRLVGNHSFQRTLFVIGASFPAVIETFTPDLLETPFGIDAGAAAFARIGVFAGKCPQSHGYSAR